VHVRRGVLEMQKGAVEAGQAIVGHTAKLAQANQNTRVS
jgi:hypothetical protein